MEKAKNDVLGDFLSLDGCIKKKKRNKKRRTKEYLRTSTQLLSYYFTHSDTCAQVTTVSLLSLSGCLVRRHLDTCGGDQINLGVPTIGTQLDESRATSNHRSHHQEWAPRRVVIF